MTCRKQSVSNTSPRSFANRGKPFQILYTTCQACWLALDTSPNILARSGRWTLRHALVHWPVSVVRIGWKAARCSRSAFRCRPRAGHTPARMPDLGGASRCEQQESLPLQPEYRIRLVLLAALRCRTCRRVDGHDACT